MMVPSPVRKAAGMIALALLPVAPAIADTMVVTPAAVQRQGAPGGGRFVLFGDIDLDSLRRVVFTASLSNGKNGVFRAAHGRVESIVMQGDDAPADAGGTFFILLEAAGNARGDVAFIASLSGPQELRGVFLKSGGVVTTVALQGQPAPTRRGESLDAFDQVQITDTGDVYFEARLANPLGKAIIHYGPSGLDSPVAPGDSIFARAVDQTLQYRVNESGEIAFLVSVGDPTLLYLTRIGDPDLLLSDPFVKEIWLYASGRQNVLSGQFLPITGFDLVLHYAFTFNQVNISDDGAASFYAGTVFYPMGGFFVNRSGQSFDDERLFSQGEPSPLAPGDRFREMGGFGYNSAQTLVFYATTDHIPNSEALFARKDGVLTTVAVAGDPRPGAGVDVPANVWHAFLMVDLNESNAFAFTDFESIAQTGVFLGRFVPPPAEVIRLMRLAIAASDLAAAEQSELLGRIRIIERYVNIDGGRQALKLAQSLRLNVAKRVGGVVTAQAYEELDPLLEDLVVSLGGPLR